MFAKQCCQDGNLSKSVRDACVSRDRRNLQHEPVNLSRVDPCKAVIDSWKVLYHST